MSLSATMWTSVSGLLTHGKKMNTIGNNIANLNTVGFKGQRMDFADFVYQDTNSLSGPTQNGFGTQVGAIMGNFSQGAFESTTESTDLAINGKGFFQVQKLGSDEAFYTRAGNFRFTPEGFLNDPSGLTLQGWRIDNSTGVMQAAGGNASSINAAEGSTSPIKGSGVPTDIQLDTWHVFPKQTTKMDFIVNLPQNGADNAKNAENPFAALFEIWDGTQPPKTANTPPIAVTSYAEQTTMQIYDEAGVKHTVSVYFDKVSPNEYEGGNDGNAIWEYIVTMDPAEDKRQFFDDETGELKKVNETKAGGLLMSGTMTYDSAGALINQSAYSWGGSQTPDTNPASFTELPDPAGGLLAKDVINLDPTDMNNWQPAAISSNGYPMFVPNFSGVLDAQTTGTANGAKYNTEFSFGVKASNLGMPWKTQGSLGDLKVDPYAFNQAYVANDSTTGPEHILLNPNYNSTKEDKWNPITNKYLLGGRELWNFDAGGNALFNSITGLPATEGLYYKDGTTPVAQADYEKMLELYNVERVAVKAGEISGTGAGVVQVPEVDIYVNLKTGKVEDKDGNPILASAAGFDADGTRVMDPDDPTIPWVAEDGVTPLPPAVIADGGINLTDPAHLKIVSKEIQDAMNLAPAKNLYLFSEADPSNANLLAEFTEPAIIEANSSSSVGTSFNSTPAQNGYGYGDLTNWDVDSDGILWGSYSNGESLPLWQLTMYDFTNTQGLRREGNNLFTETKDSGQPTSGPAGSSGLGTINSHSLEQSNVDMSTEFVYMITTQRGYQSNSKLITTVDQMLETVINMKR